MYFLTLWKLDIQDRGASRAGFLGGPSPRLTDGPIFLRPHTAFPLCAHIPGVSVCPDFFLYVPIRLDWSTHLVALFQLNHLFKGPVST